MGLKERIIKDEEELEKLNQQQNDADTLNDENQENLDTTQDQNEDPDSEENSNTEEELIDEENQLIKEEEEKTSQTKNEDTSEDTLQDRPDDKEPKTPQNNQDAAKLRIERRERLQNQKKQAEEKFRQQEILRQEQLSRQQPPNMQQVAQNNPDVRPEINEDIEWAKNFRQQEEQKQLRQRATDEFITIENQFKQSVPDYEPASQHMIKSMYQAALHIDPTINERQAVEIVQKKILDIASEATMYGQNPAEVLYQMAYDRYNFNPQAQNMQKNIAPNAAQKLKKSAKNKKRSVNGLSGGGQSTSSHVSVKEALNMGNADFGKLSNNRIDELIKEAENM